MTVNLLGSYNPASPFAKPTTKLFPPVAIPTPEPLRYAIENRPLAVGEKPCPVLEYATLHEATVYFEVVRNASPRAFAAGRRRLVLIDRINHGGPS